MPIQPGTRLGPYEVAAPIGSGGMGEVYSATDTRLDRTVAIKVLPEHLADDPQRRERFEREAKAVSSLNHPHICTLHDVGEQDGTHYLVMELVEGDTLAARLEKGRLPLDQALEYAIQTADALDKAHRQGIVHRDLKPGNIMLTKSGVKLLDFGLAKLKGDTGPASTLSQMATEDASKPLTAEGSIIGTLQYMAPEQLEGKEADNRTDIFAFGAVVYEMVTGKRAFEGKSQVSLMAAILEHEPQPMMEVQSMTPRSLDHVVRTCLAKDPDGRWQTARDLMREVRWVADGGSEDAVVEPEPNGNRNQTRESIAWALVAALVITVGFMALSPSETDVPRTETMRFSVPLPMALIGRADINVSPDGRYVAANTFDPEVNFTLWLRSFDSLDGASLERIGSARTPIWSPDGQDIAFFTQGKLMKISTVGGAVQEVSDLPVATEAIVGMSGGSWGSSDIILISAGGTIYSAPASGGDPTPVTMPVEGERHVYPEFLPDGERFLYVSNPRGVLYLKAPGEEPIEILSGLESPARYSPTGHLVFVRGGELWSQRFDLSTTGTIGEPVSLASLVNTQRDLLNTLFDVSNQHLYYQSGTRSTQLVWKNRLGQELSRVGEPRNYTNLV